MLSLLLYAALAVAPGGGCGPEVDALLKQLNRARSAAGAIALEAHPALCETARERVTEIVSKGAIAQGVEAITRRTRSLYAKRYAAHAWSEAAIIGGGQEPVLEQFQQVRPDWHRKALIGDFEQMGAARGNFRGRPIFAILLALPERTVKWRQVEPLRDPAWVQSEVLATVNRLRADAGLSAVTLAPALSAAAQAHAEQMLERGFYDHLTPEGATPRQRAAAAGYRDAQMIAENIAKGSFSPSEIVERWMKSSGHRQNILRAQAEEMGVGVAFGESSDDGERFEVLWAQLFAGK